MSFSKRAFLITCFIISTILLALNAVTYFLFRHSFTEQLLSSQNALINANNDLCHLFTQEVDQLSYLYTSDEKMGRLLSMPVGQDSLEDMQTKISLNSQMAYILNSQSSLSSKGFSAILYINPNLPVSALFQPDATVPLVSRLFSGEAVELEDWYQHALEQTSRQYIFLDEEGDRICFAKKLQNSHYTGSYQKNGIGVLLGSVPISRVPQLLSFHSLTDNSGFVLLNREGTLLYQSDTLPRLPDSSPLFTGEQTDQELVLNNHVFLYSSTELDWGLQLLFLTPYSDISNQLYGIMVPYLFCSVIFLVLGALFSILLSREISQPVIQFTKKLERIEDTRNVDLNAFSNQGPLEIRRLNASFSNLIYRINWMTEQVANSAEQRRQSELRALQAQMNPHFMLNAMNTVNYMALMRGEDDIAATVDSIANLMRYSITDPDELVSIHTEVENIREYISIYTLRFRQDIRLEIAAEGPDTEIFIPKFTLQPLVENSIRHGITRQDFGITVFVRAWRETDKLCVEVTDTGKGADAEKLNAYLHHENVNLKVSHGFGIRNVNERLQLHFGGSSGLSYSTDENGRLAARITICSSEKNAPNQKNSLF